MSVYTTIEEDIDNAVARVAADTFGTQASTAPALREWLLHLLEGGKLFWAYGGLCYIDPYTDRLSCAVTGIPIE